MKRDEYGRALTDNVPEPYIGDDGKIRSYAEINEAKLRAAHAARLAQIHADREAEAKKSDLQKRTDVIKAQYDDARHNGDKRRAEMYKAKLDTLHEDLASEQAQAAKVKAFASDRRIENIRTEATLIERSGQHLLPHASQLECDELIAVARSEAFPDPESQYQAFKEISDRLTAQEIEHERIKQSDAEIESARYGAIAAESRVRTAELAALQAKREGVADGQ